VTETNRLNSEQQQSVSEMCPFLFLRF